MIGCCLAPARVTAQHSQYIDNDVRTGDDEKEKEREGGREGGREGRKEGRTAMHGCWLAPARMTSQHVTVSTMTTTDGQAMMRNG